MNTNNSKKKIIIQSIVLVVLIIVVIVVVRRQHTTPYRTNEGMVFGTIYHVTYQCDRDLQDKIEDVLQDVDNSLSPFNKNSVITKVNNNIDVTVDSMFIDVFNLAQEISKETDGAFDITVAPLVNAWGFGFKNDKQPTRAVIDSLMQIIGYQKVTLNDNNTVVKKDSRIMLDCSAIAKGYGTDQVARVLRKNGVENFMVEIGGEIVTQGINSKRLPWRIGVTKPTDDSLQTNKELQTILNVTDIAMATSGNYRNFYYKDGKKYAHTINPKTGYPVQHNILSATVIADRCATADAYATAFMVIGLDKAKEILDGHPEIMAYFIYSDKDGSNAVWYSPSLKDKIAE